MMTSPEMFAEIWKDKSYADLVKEKNSLIEEITRFENGDIHQGEIIIHPTPDVVYQCNLEYLSELCKLIVDKYQDEFTDSERTFLLSEGKICTVNLSKDI